MPVHLARLLSFDWKSEAEDGGLNAIESIREIELLRRVPVSARPVVSMWWNDSPISRADGSSHLITWVASQHSICSELVVYTGAGGAP